MAIGGGGVPARTLRVVKKKMFADLSEIKAHISLKSMSKSSTVHCERRDVERVIELDPLHHIDHAELLRGGHHNRTGDVRLTTAAGHSTVTARSQHGHSMAPQEEGHAATQ